MAHVAIVGEFEGCRLDLLRNPYSSVLEEGIRLILKASGVKFARSEWYKESDSAIVQRMLENIVHIYKRYDSKMESKRTCDKGKDESDEDSASSVEDSYKSWCIFSLHSSSFSYGCSSVFSFLRLNVSFVDSQSVWPWLLMPWRGEVLPLP